MPTFLLVTESTGSVSPGEYNSRSPPYLGFSERQPCSSAVFWIQQAQPQSQGLFALKYCCLEDAPQIPRLPGLIAFHSLRNNWLQHKTYRNTLLKTDTYFCCILLTSFIFLHTWLLSRDECLPVNVYERMCHRLCVCTMFERSTYTVCST